MQNVKYLCHIVKHTNLNKMKKLQLPLPNYFKKIGIGIILFAVIVSIPFTICLFKYNPEAFENYKLIGMLLIDITAIGLLLYVGAKEKVEDELIAKIRTQSMAYAFIISFIVIIIYPYYSYFIHNQIEDAQGKVIILVMPILYIIIFRHNKKNM